HGRPRLDDAAHASDELLWNTPAAGHFGKARIIRCRRAVHAHPLVSAFCIGAIEGTIDVHPADAAGEGRATDLGAVAIDIDLLVGRAEEDGYRPVVLFLRHPRELALAQG